MTIETQDFQLKHDGAVLIVHVYIRATQDVTKLQKQVIRAAKGPRLDAIAVWMEVHAPGDPVKSPGVQAGESKIQEFLRASTIDVVTFHLCVNTDTDPQKLGENIQRAARGPRFDDVKLVIEVYAGNEGRKVWSLIQSVVTQAYARPSAKPFSI